CANPVRRADRRHPRRSDDVSRDERRVLLQGGRARAGEGEGGAGRSLGGRGNAGRSGAATARRNGARRTRSRARRAPHVLRFAGRGALCGVGGDRRSARHRQEPPPARARRPPRGPLRRPLGEVPLIRRGHHVLARHGDLQVRGRDPAERRPRDQRGTARRVPRDARHGGPRRAPDDRLRPLEPDRYPDHAARDIRDERDLTGRAPLGHPASAAAPGDAAFAETPFAAGLIANAGGNPLFLEETVRMLREEGLLDLERWQSEEMRYVPVPTSVQGLISSRLDRLETKEKQLAHHASVIGAVFWAGAVAHLGAPEGAAPEDPRPGLAELERRDFVAHLHVSSVADDQEYSFKHILMRDVAYGQVPKGRRAQLHLGFSEWVKSLPSSADEFVEIIAWHLEQACLLSREVARSPIEPPFREAATTLADAGRRAERRESLREAHRYYTRALDVLGDEHEELRVELRLRRADMAMMLGLVTEATNELLEVADDASKLDRVDVECEAMLLLGDIDQRQGRPTEAHERLTEAERLASVADDPYLRVRVAFVLNTFVADHSGRLEQVIENLRSAIVTADEIHDHALVGEGHLRIASQLMSHDLAAAEAELRRCLELA